MQKSTLFLLIVALASAGVSAGLWMELRAERALNAELSERLVVAAATPIAPPPVADGRPEPTSVVAPPASAPPPMAAEPEAVKPVRDLERWQTRQRKLMDDPRFREVYREQQRLRLATRRENFIRLLGFTPEQADAVISLSIDQQMQMEQGAGKPGEYDARILELLGQEKSEKLQAYMESRQTRMQVDQFRTQLTGADMLRDDQVEPLIAAMHAERSQMQRDLQEFVSTSLSQDTYPAATQQKYVERETELLKEAYDRMRSSAAAILSDSQLQKLTAMLKRDIDRRATQLQMSRIQSKLERSGEPPGNSN